MALLARFLIATDAEKTFHKGGMQMTASRNRVAAVFPGQGAQRPGMGRDFHDCAAVCRETYEEASDALGWDVAAMCFGNDERLDRTEYTQPCLLTTELAMFRGLCELHGIHPSLYGGHSLGEFTALVAAGVIPLSDAVRIVQSRGRLMQEAAPAGLGGMAAVIADALDADDLDHALSDLPVDIANVNSPKQIVLSGAAEALSEAAVRIVDVLEEGRPFRFVPLNVSAPFHSRFMRCVEGEFSRILQSLSERMDAKKAVAVTSNFTGGFHETNPDDLLRALTCQIGSRVRWVDNMEAIAAEADRIYEIGPARPLREFFKSIDVHCLSVTTLSSASRLFGSN